MHHSSNGQNSIFPQEFHQDQVIVWCGLKLLEVTITLYHPYFLLSHARPHI